MSSDGNEYLSYGHLRIPFADRFRTMTDEERATYYPNQVVGSAWIAPDRDEVLRIDHLAEPVGVDDLQGRLLEYRIAYERLAPGFQVGELLMRDAAGGGVAVMTFKSNALMRDLYNVLALVSAYNSGYVLLYSCDMKDAVTTSAFWTNVFTNLKLVDDGELM